MKRPRPTTFAADDVPADGAPSWRELSASQRGRRWRKLARMMRRLTVGASMIMVTSGAGAIAWTALRGDQDEARRTTLERFGTAVATSAAEVTADALEANDVATLTRLGTALIARDGIASIGFLDAAGRPVARIGPDVADAKGAGPRVSLPVRIAATAAAPAHVVGTIWLTAKANAVDVVTPGEQPVIVVATAVGGTMAMLSVLVAAAYVRRRFEPVRQLAKLVRRARADAGDAPLPWDSNVNDAGDEVGELVVALESFRANARLQRDEHVARIAQMTAAIADLHRTIEHRSGQLTTANERLVGEIAEKEDFVRAISHDLNAPLRNIGGMVTTLIAKHSTTMTEEGVGKLERVKANVVVLTDLINELLEFSRIKTRRQSLHLVELEQLLWELRGMFENDLKTREISIVIETSLPNLFAERVRVRQIFQNLIDNAIKYMGDGHDVGNGRRLREIRIGCRVSVNEAEFYVSDTGMGIATEDHDRVFVIFRRGTDEQSRKVAGKGVGLASVKSIVETYAGRIWVESEKGVGTTFRFTINGQFVPSVSGQIPDQMAGQATQRPPSLAA